MCDIFLTLAMTPGTNTPTCFIVPRWIPNGGGRNTGFKVMRLKDKLADRANASSEVEYDGAYAEMLGEEGKGVKTIIEMVQSTRLDCIIGSAGGARRALTYALNHAVRIVLCPLPADLFSLLIADSTKSIRRHTRAASFDGEPARGPMSGIRSQHSHSDLSLSNL
jgi:putative acyl-CoA dehydrogenase